MTDLEVIQRFQEEISWAHETTLLPHADRTLLEGELAIYVPTKWQEAEGSVDYVAALSKEFSKRVVLLAWGDPSSEDTVRIYQNLLRVDVHTHFIDVTARVAQIFYVTQALDGVDWGRTIEAVAEGGCKTKPIYEWD